MKKILSFLISSTSVVLMPSEAFAYDTLARQAIIYDASSDVVLYAHNATEPMIPASMTKIMTAYMVFERLSDGRLKPTDTFRVSERAWREGGWASGGSTMGLSIGEDVSVTDLLRGMLVQSGNDSCIVIAEGISGSEEAFAAEMTSTAKKLGLSTASFRNSTGLLADGHEISAYDLARLADMTIEKFPEYYPIYAEPVFSWNGIRQPNRNPLLSRFAGADGLKTGHLDASGYGLVGSAEVNGVRRIVVINGMNSERERADESERILRSSFRDFSILEAYKAGDQIAEIPVWLGENDSVAVSVSEDLAFGIKTADRDKIKAHIVIDAPAKAPITKGQQIGTLVLTGLSSGDKTVPLIAQSDIKKAGILKRALKGLTTLLAPRGSTPDAVTSTS